MADFTLWHGDCLEEMDRIEDGSIDCILTDLPYNVTNCHWDTLIPFEPLWKQYKRVIKKNGAVVLFGSQPFTSMLVMSNLEWFKYSLVWENTKATGHFNSNHQPLRAHQDITVFSPSASTYSRGDTMTYNPQLERGKAYTDKRTHRPDTSYKFHASLYKKIPVENKDTRYPRSVIKIPFEQGLHSTQKPVALMEYLIKTYTNEGDTILDNTCGSGSTLEAAMRNNRHSIGIEKDAHYFNVATERLARVAAELRGELNHLPMFAEAA